MPLIKMGTAARRARAGSTNTIRRALIAAGIPLVTSAPGVWAVEEADLERFLESRQERPAAPPPPKPRPHPAASPIPAEVTAKKAKAQKRRQ
jgi:hypothetical protein